ncbi:MAG: hypothetical protein ACTSXN_10530 [Promethearchaeota archaeon]
MPRNSVHQSKTRKPCSYWNTTFDTRATTRSKNKVRPVGSCICCISPEAKPSRLYTHSKAVVLPPKLGP